MKLYKITYFIVAGLLFFTLLQAQNVGESKLDIKTIMQNPVMFSGYAPQDIHWSEKGNTLYFKWNPEANPVPGLYKYKIGAGAPEVLPANDLSYPLPGEKVYLEDFSKMLFTVDNTLAIHELDNYITRHLLSLNKKITSLVAGNEDDKVYFNIEKDLYVLYLHTGFIKQLTKVVENKSAESDPDTQEEWLENQQGMMFDVFKAENNKKAYADSVARAKNTDLPMEIDTGKGSLTSVKASPSGKFAVAMLYEPYSAGKQTEIPHFVTRSGFTEHKKARKKVGAPYGQMCLRVLDFENDTIRTLSFVDFPGISNDPEYFAVYNRTGDGLPKKTTVTEIEWSPDGSGFIGNLRSLDNKDRWIFYYNASENKVQMLNWQHDSAWVAGPGIGYTWGGASIGWLDEGRTIWFLSEKTGYAHLYRQKITADEAIQLTSGSFEIYDPVLSRDKKNWYFTANKKHPGIRHVYKMPASGGKMQQLTTIDGGYELVLSPDEEYLALRYSASDKPWELYLMKNQPGAAMKQITTSSSGAFLSYPWRKPDLVTFEAADGARVHARLYKPKEAVKNGAAVIFVHGAGYLQNAHQWWSSYFREYMFHNLLVDEGYTVLDIDYRGSAGYGRDWRTAIYRHMGGKDLSDQIDGAAYLVKDLDIDPERIGIYGGSYGGFITLMALFRHPGTFAAGAALRSVTDWAHYNHGYTSNILNTPVLDSIAFYRSSPINFPEGLADDLLICHGMVDDNVQFQDVVRLTQRLIEMGKDDWEFAVYPVEPHSFQEPTSWTDEYKRIYKLFQKELNSEN